MQGSRVAGILVLLVGGNQKLASQKARGDWEVAKLDGPVKEVLVGNFSPILAQ
jgi:hypothetical protein